MARSDQVKALLRSHREGDDDAFRSTAEAIIADERRKRHDLLAKELEAILHEPVRTRRTGVVSTLRPLPTGREDTPLLRVVQPERSLHDLVLDPRLRLLVEELIEEQHTRAALRAHAVGPRSSLLFAGPSGTGKSAMAEAIAGELGWPIAHVQLATVVSSFLGETAKNLEQVFEFVKSGTYVLLFDEFEMFARDRAEGADHGELKRVVATLLQLIEHSRTDSLVIATTNHADLLDSALWRRFDDVFRFELPSDEACVELLKMKLRSVRVRTDLEDHAQQLVGCTHAEIEAVAFDAIRRMVRELDRALNAGHVRYAIERLEDRRQIIQHSRG